MGVRMHVTYMQNAYIVLLVVSFAVLDHFNDHIDGVEVLVVQDLVLQIGEIGGHEIDDAELIDTLMYG